MRLSFKAAPFLVLELVRPEVRVSAQLSAPMAPEPGPIDFGEASTPCSEQSVNFSPCYGTLRFLDT